MVGPAEGAVAGKTVGQVWGLLRKAVAVVFSEMLISVSREAVVAVAAAGASAVASDTGTIGWQPLACAG